MGIERACLSSADLASRASAMEKAARATVSGDKKTGMTKSVLLEAAAADRKEVTDRQKSTITKIASFAGEAFTGVAAAAAAGMVHLVAEDALNAFINR